MAWSAVFSAATKIGDLLTQEVVSLLGVEEQVDDLQRELRWMQSFLKEADTRQADQSEVVHNCVTEIKELAYDAEDVIETFALKIASKRKGGLSNAIRRSGCFLKEGWLLHETKSEIQKITAKVIELTRRLQTYDVKKIGDIGEGYSSSLNDRRELRRPYPHIIEDNIVGFDDEIKKLVSVLIDEESRCRVVSICGMGGLGKTTLAKRVYHHSQIRGHFTHLAWVYVSQQCQKRKVWLDILSGFNIMDKKDMKKRDEDLAEKLFNFLKDKNCLVILDDVWNIQAWDSLEPAFPRMDTSSKILLTSRNKEVASHADRRGYLRELECLKEEDCWELFQKTAFPNRGSPDFKIDERIEKWGKEMLKHCAGLPLAIIVLGGILATKLSLKEWQMVYENAKNYLKRGRGRGQGIEDVLALSYDDLPSYLRPCFLYLSHFPEDYEIHANRLIQLWVAEGIVSSKQDERNEAEIEDVAECYLIELAERCMIQVGEKDTTLKIKTCRMHDLMRDLCLSKAKQENFLYIIDCSNEYRSGNSFPSSSIRRVRRIVACQESPLIQSIKTPHLRSLFYFCEFFPDKALPMVAKYLEEHAEEVFSPAVWVLVIRVLCKIQGLWTYLFNNFKLLRVLNFEGANDLFGGCKLHSDIGNLIHLRFLSLKGFEFLFTSNLPSSLGNLRCLQTLDLRVKSDVYIPNVIWRMEQLRHLYFPKRFDCKSKLKLDNLRNLQTLVNFKTNKCYVRDLLNLTNLRKLKISELYKEDFKEDLYKKPAIIRSKYLRSLSIYFPKGIDPRNLTDLLSSCSNICELSLVGQIGKLPEYFHFSSDISYLHLDWSNLDEDPIPTLEKLPNLRILKFSYKSFTGKKMVCSAECFPKLDSLSLRELYNFEEWKVDEGAMPALRRLEIYACKNLKMLPDGLRFISTLQELSIKSMPKAFKDKVVEGGEDFYKAQHIPSIIFQDCDEFQVPTYL